MPRYIDADRFTEWLKTIPVKDLSDGKGLCRVIFAEDFSEAVKNIPKHSIQDVREVKHAQWVEAEGLLVCSNCGHVTEDMVHETVEGEGKNKHIRIQSRYPYYCGKCGARCDL